MHKPIIEQEAIVPVVVYEKNGLHMLEYGTSDFVIVNEKKEGPKTVYTCTKPNGRTTFIIVKFADGTFSKMSRGDRRRQF